VTLSDEQVALLDRAAIRELLDEYWYGLGRGDVDTVVGVFTDDAKYGLAEGRGDIKQAVEGISALRCINIVGGSARIVVDGDTATADTQAVAFLAMAAGDGERILVQGLRYVDELVRTAAGWRIARRTGLDVDDRPHDEPWEFSVEATPVTPLGRRH
jgi:hypothetical protein